MTRGMPIKIRTECDSDMMYLHKPVPPHELQSKKAASVCQRSSSGSERRSPYIRSATQRSTGDQTHSKLPADMTHTHSPYSIKQLQEQFLSEQQEAESITQPLLDTENGFIKDLDLYLDHRDTLALRKREHLHKRWTECVWRPIQRSVQRRFTHSSCEGAEPMRIMFNHYVNYRNTKGFVFLESYDPEEYQPFLLHLSRPQSFQVRTPPLKDPLLLQSRARTKEKRAVLRCQTGKRLTDQEEEGRDKSNQQRNSRSRGSVYLAAEDGRCFQSECWSSIGSSPHC